MNLLDFPPEIRLRIYEFAALQPHAICINKGWNEPSIVTAVKRDSRDIAKIYYGGNTFVYYFTAYHFGGSKFDTPNFEDFADRVAVLSEWKRCYLRALEVVCFWVDEIMTVDEARQKIEETLAQKGVTLRKAVLKFMGKEDAWLKLSLSR